jgi:transposase
MALAKHKMQENPLSGDLFVFVNRRKIHIKILHFDRSGYCILMNRLEEGRFQHPILEGDKAQLSGAQLTLISEGIDLKKFTSVSDISMKMIQL